MNKSVVKSTSRLSVTDAILGRTSIRAFKPDPVPQALVRDIIDVARFAPSGSNLQPWRIIAVAGTARRAVIEATRESLTTKPQGEGAEFPSRPSPIWEPYRSRRFRNNEAMYDLLNIPRSEKAARLAHIERNGDFFGAPVGLFLVIDRRFGHSQWVNLGMLMQSIALAALERGLSSCMQEYWGQMRETLRLHFRLPQTDVVFCGMALGYADAAAPVNKLRSERAPVDEICEFRGFP